MAKIIEWSDKQKREWDEWVASRPSQVKELCRKLPPDRLYLLMSSGHRVTIRSYCEDGTVTVNVTGQYNVVTFDRSVFGIKPEDLEECDLPSKDEPLGTLLTQDEDIEQFIGAARANIQRD